MNTLVEEATLQFLQESKGLFDNLPMFGVDAGDLILQIKSNNTSLPELRKEPEWQQVYTLLIKKVRRTLLGGAPRLGITRLKTCRLRIKPSPRQRPQKY